MFCIVTLVLCSMYAVPNVAVYVVPWFPAVPVRCSVFSEWFGKVPVALIISGSTVVFTFHMHCVTVIKIFVQIPCGYHHQSFYIFASVLVVLLFYLWTSNRPCEVSVAEEVHGAGDMEEGSTRVVNIQQPWKPFWRTSDLGLFSSATKVSGLMEYQCLY
jgi:hypothetical protein